MGVNSNQVYWLLISFYSTIQVEITLSHLMVDIPFYFIYIIAAACCFFLYKYLNKTIEAKENRSEYFIWLIQALLIILHMQVPYTLWNVLFPLLFILLEIGRFTVLKEKGALLRQNDEYKDLIDQYNDLFQVVHSERHDFLKHISAVHFMVEKDGNQEIKQYLNQLVEGYGETNLSIKGEKGAVASVLHRMYRKAQEKNINIEYDLDVPLSTLPMTEKSIVELVGNILSNSIEASDEYQERHKKRARVICRISKRSGFYLLTCKNDCLPIPESILDHLFEKFGKSTKAGENRGYGTKIIHDLVRKHHGYLDYTYKDKNFTLKIKIPAISGAKY